MASIRMGGGEWMLALGFSKLRFGVKFSSPELPVS